MKYLADIDLHCEEQEDLLTPPKLNIARGKGEMSTFYER